MEGLLGTTGVQLHWVNMAHIATYGNVSNVNYAATRQKERQLTSGKWVAKREKRICGELVGSGPMPKQLNSLASNLL